MVFAQLERETIAERIKDNYYQRVKKGAWPGGPAPYGFQIAKERINGSSTLEQKPEEIEVVKRIFDMYASPGASLYKVAKTLTQSGIQCARRKTWDSISVSRILRNPILVKADADIYAYYKMRGLIIYNELEEFTGENGGIIVGKRTANERKYTNLSNHLFAISANKGIIDSSLFLACQHKMDENKQIKNKGKGKYTWLSGLLHCANCGYSLRVQKDNSCRGKLRLVCSGRTNFCACDWSHSETVEAAEAFAEHSIIKIIASGRIDQKEKNEQSIDTNGLKMDLYKIEDKIKNLIAAIAEGNEITQKYINAEIQRLDQEKATILQKMADSSISKKDKMVGINFAELPFEQKKQIAHILVENVICSPERFEIVWK